MMETKNEIWKFVPSNETTLDGPQVAKKQNKRKRASFT